jgi:hypothetical protein
MSLSSFAFDKKAFGQGISLHIPFYLSKVTVEMLSEFPPIQPKPLFDSNCHVVAGTADSLQVTLVNPVMSPGAGQKRGHI